jgi:hypothetical protein
MTVRPVNFTWRVLDVVGDGGEITRVKAMVPAPRYAALAAKQYTDGDGYTLTPLEERSMASHAQFFAALKSGYDNLPERVFFRIKDGKFELDGSGNKIPRWPTPTHYRRWLLIETGWYDQRDIVEATPAHAKRLAVWIRTDIGGEADYWRIQRDDCTVVIKKAKSQSMPAMKKDDFEKSKRDVLELNDAMSGVEPGTHWREAGNAA